MSNIRSAAGLFQHVDNDFHCFLLLIYGRLKSLLNLLKRKLMADNRLYIYLEEMASLASG